MRFFVAGVILLLLLGGVHYYVASRLFCGLSVFFTGMGKPWLWSTFSLFALLTAFGFLRSLLPFSQGVKVFLGTVFSYWLGIFIYLFLFTLLFDLAGLIFRLCRFSFAAGDLHRGILIVLAIVFTAGTVLYGTRHAKEIKNVSYEVNIQNKEDISDLNIVLISDLHLGAVGIEGNLENIVFRINALSPDIVCIAGDLFDSDFGAVSNPEKASLTLKGLSSTYGVYACLGNHDAGQTAGQMLSFLEDSGIVVLNNEYRVIDERLILLGRPDASPIGGYGELSRKPLEDFFEGSDTLPVISLDHNPSTAFSDSKGVDLCLSGHTHKGQLFPAGIVTNLLFPVDWGYYKEEGSPHMVVTSGVGYWGMPMRVGTDCEIVSLKITCQTMP